MKRVVITVVFLLLSLSFSNAQWRELPCTITGDDDFAHSSSVSNKYSGNKEDFYRFTDNHNSDFSNLLTAGLAHPLYANVLCQIISDSAYTLIKSIRANILKQRE